MIRHAFGALIFLTLTGCAQTKVTSLAPDEYVIEQTRHEPPMSYESRALTKQAEKLCPNGYSYLLRQNKAESDFAKHHGECAMGANCEYVLQWRIRCGNIPREPFSLFGKT